MMELCEGIVCQETRAGGERHEPTWLGTYAVCVQDVELEAGCGGTDWEGIDTWVLLHCVLVVSLCTIKLVELEAVCG